MTASKTGSWLLRGPEQHFADERLRSLCHQHGDDAGYIIGLDLFVWVFPVSAAFEAGVRRSRRDDRDADAVWAQLLGDGVGQAIQAPLRGGIGGSVGEGAVSRER